MIAAIFFYKNQLARTSEMFGQAVKAVSEFAQRSQHLTEENRYSEQEHPVKGNKVYTNGKARYERRLNRERCDEVRYNDADRQLFENNVHLSRQEFDTLYTICFSELLRPLNVRGNIGEDQDEGIPHANGLARRICCYFCLICLVGLTKEVSLFKFLQKFTGFHREPYLTTFVITASPCLER